MKSFFSGLILAATLPALAANELTLDGAIHQALKHDQWLQSNSLKEQALREEAVRHAALPDPSLSVGIANLPVDSWAFDQENMTQLKLGLTQRFPGGDSRAVKARKSQLMADVNPLQRIERRAQLSRSVAHLWLDSYFASKSIELIEADRHLFEQLVEIATARYKSAIGKARQQDVVRAQLALTRLEDRLTRLRLQQDTQRQLLAQWLPVSLHSTPLASRLPLIQPATEHSSADIKQLIKRHPRLLIADQQIEIQQSDMDLARESYKPGWALNAAYGYREDNPSGMERADFFSIGVNLELPLFTSNRQDRTLSASRSRKQALALDYQLLHKRLTAEALKTVSAMQRLQQRADLYEHRLLQQAHQQAEASLSAYTNDDGDFAEVMRAYIAELNSKIEALEIRIEQHKALATMNYLLTGNKLAAQGDIQ